MKRVVRQTTETNIWWIRGKVIYYKSTVVRHKNIYNLLFIIFINFNNYNKLLIKPYYLVRVIIEKKRECVCVSLWKKEKKMEKLIQYTDPTELLNSFSFLKIN